MANLMSHALDYPPESSPPQANQKLEETDDIWQSGAGADDGSFHCRRMTHPGTSRHPHTRPRIPLVHMVSKSQPPALKGHQTGTGTGSHASLVSNGSSNGTSHAGQVWVVQVSPSAQQRDDGQTSRHLSKESLVQSAKSPNGRSLENINAESRAVELLSREYDSVLSSAPANSKLVDKAEATPLDPDSCSDASLKPKEESSETMLAGMAPALILGQCFSLLAVSNVAGRHGRASHFRWLSLRMFYSAVISMLLGLSAVLAMYDLIRRGDITLGSSQVVAFYLSGFAATCTYMRLASRWTAVCSAFDTMEARLTFYGNSAGLQRRMRGLTALILILALVEHGLAQLNTLVYMQRTMTNSTAGQWLFSYYVGNFKHVDRILPFHPIFAAACILLNTTATFVWNYNDLFIMLMSIAISHRFRVLNQGLIASAHEEKDSKMWQHARETFNAIATLTRTVDLNLSALVLVSFVNNLYFICIQLLHNVRHDKNTVYENVYFAFSFGWLLLRAVSVSLFAASIYEESRATKRVLYAVSSNSYCDEVERFLLQVTTDDIALTGCNFFNVNRSLLLTLVGTVTTYEVVLVQFNGFNSNN